MVVNYLQQEYINFNNDNNFHFSQKNNNNKCSRKQTNKNQMYDTVVGKSHITYYCCVCVHCTITILKPMNGCICKHIILWNNRIKHIYIFNVVCTTNSIVLLMACNSSNNTSGIDNAWFYEFLSEYLVHFVLLLCAQHQHCMHYLGWIW